MPKLNPQDDGEMAPGTVVDGRYKVVRTIGQGGNGMVYEVEHARTGRKLALKALLDETGFARLEQEARAASLMKNGHTAKIVDMEPGGPTGAYMVMELLEGQSLRGLLDDAGQLPLELTVNIALQVCECLHEAHGLGIIHRDLKPENVYLCASPWPGQYDVKVLDFGVMKIADGGGAIPKSSLTRTGSTVGTPYYMSLEQLRNSSAVDARADVYSLGVVLYECLSGRKPYQADTIGDLVYALCSGPPTHLSRLRPDLPSEVADIVMRTLSANREDRPTSMIELAVALLAHGNPAFALWVKVNGKQPALSPARPPSASLPDARASMPFLEPAPQAPPPPPAEPGPPLAPTMLAPQQIDSGRRDTPTEMYVKGVHGAPEEAESARSEPGAHPADRPGAVRDDRDTPTRAYNIDAAPRRVVETLKSPSGEAAPVGDPTLQTHMLAPNTPAAKMTIRLGQVPEPPPSAPMSAAPMSTPMPASSVLTPPKPAWQAKLDGLLIAIGRFGEAQMKRFREAPQNTQIIVVIVVGTVIILMLGFLLFLALH
jgi:serine/threonine-protein kinase